MVEEVTLDDPITERPPRISPTFPATVVRSMLATPFGSMLKINAPPSSEAELFEMFVLVTVRVARLCPFADAPMYAPPIAFPETLPVTIESATLTL